MLTTAMLRVQEEKLMSDVHGRFYSVGQFETVMQRVDKERPRLEEFDRLAAIHLSFGDTGRARWRFAHCGRCGQVA